MSGSTSAAPSALQATMPMCFMRKASTQPGYHGGHSVGFCSSPPWRAAAAAPRAPRTPAWPPPSRPASTGAAASAPYQVEGGLHGTDWYAFESSCGPLQPRARRRRARLLEPLADRPSIWRATASTTPSGSASTGRASSPTAWTARRRRRRPALPRHPARRARIAACGRCHPAPLRHADLACRAPGCTPRRHELRGLGPLGGTEYGGEVDWW
jgi:hypothetical protein